MIKENKINEKQSSDFLKGYNDAVQGKATHFEGKSIDYIKGYKSYYSYILKKIDDCLKGYEDAENNIGQDLQNKSQEYIVGYSNSVKKSR